MCVCVCARVDVVVTMNCFTSTAPFLEDSGALMTPRRKTSDLLRKRGFWDRATPKVAQGTWGCSHLLAITLQASNCSAGKGAPFAVLSSLPLFHFVCTKKYLAVRFVQSYLGSLKRDRIGWVQRSRVII